MAARDSITSVEYRQIPKHAGYRAGGDGSIWTCWKFKGGGYAGKPLYYQSDEWRKLKGYPRKEDGRLRFTLRLDTGKYRRAYGSTLILEAFVGPCPPGMEACHDDGDCLNNAADNLRWDTSLNNKADMLRHGTRLQGVAMANAKLDEAAVRDIRRTGKPLRPLAEKYGVTPTLISYVLNRRIWTHVE